MASGEDFTQENYQKIMDDFVRGKAGADGAATDVPTAVEEELGDDVTRQDSKSKSKKNKKAKKAQVTDSAATST